MTADDIPDCGNLKNCWLDKRTRSSLYRAESMFDRGREQKARKLTRDHLHEPLSALGYRQLHSRTLLGVPEHTGS